MPRNQPATTAQRRLHVVVAIAALLLYWLVWSGLPHAIDELVALAVSESMLTGDGFIVNQLAWEQAQTPSQTAFGTDGNLYSRHGIGVSLVALPLWFTGTWWSSDGAVRLALLTGSLLAALAVGCMVWCAQQLGYRDRTALLAGVALGAGTLLMPYARTLFSEAVAGPALTLALAAALAWRATGARSRWLLLMTGLGLAGLTLANSAHAVIAPFFALYLLFVTWRAHSGGRPRALVKAGLLAGAPLLLAVGATLAYNYVRFGTLAGFALEPFAHLDTPQFAGAMGLFFGAAKALIWYMPLALLGLVGAFWVLLRPRAHALARSDALLALAAIAAPVVLHALWHQWEGARAWSPRVVAWLAPALVLLALPLLDKATAVAPGEARDRFARAAIWLVLGVSIVMQMPGALVNFAQPDGVVWQSAFSPLPGDWRALASPALEPVLLQVWTWWQRPIGATLALVLGAVTIWLLRWYWREGAQARLWLAALAALSTGLVLAGATSDDPRWLDRSANPEDNLALIAYLEARAYPDDLLLFDLQQGRDVQSRAWWRQNALPAPPAFVGWLRKDTLTPEHAAFLMQQWQDRPRVWLVLEETAEEDPAPTTEQFMDTILYRGGVEWLGAQRVVQYVMPAGEVIAAGNAASFDAVLLTSWQVRAALAEELWLVDLLWEQPIAADLRLVVQALDEAGEVIAQVERAPSPGMDRVGIDAPGAQRIILKLYNVETGEVAPAPHGDALVLWQLEM